MTESEYIAELNRRFVIDTEAGTFTRKFNTQRGGKKGQVVSGKTNRGYITIRLFNKQYLAHRLMWLFVYGEWPNGFIDHINRNKTDNSIKNLRVATPKLNSENRSLPKNNSTGHVGIYWDKDNMNWRAKIGTNKKSMSLGSYENIDDALKVRKDAEQKYFYKDAV